MNTIGHRLREERMRLGISQDELAAAGGVQRRAQGNYERGERSPDSEYLAGISKTGVDILYIVTGSRGLTEEQLAQDLQRYADAWETLELALAKFKRTLSPEKKRKAVDALYRASKAQIGADREQLTALVLELAA